MVCSCAAYAAEELYLGVLHSAGYGSVASSAKASSLKTTLGEQLENQR